MNRQKKSGAEPSHVEQYEQMLSTQEQCKRVWQICKKTLEQVPDFSIAYLLHQMCRCHMQIIHLLDSNTLHPKANNIDFMPCLASSEPGMAKDAVQEPLGKLLDFQHGLLQKLRKTIRVQKNRNLAYQLSASVASLQLLHDQLGQKHNQVHF